MVFAVILEKVVLPRSLTHREMPGYPFNELLGRVLADVKARPVVGRKIEVNAMKTWKLGSVLHDEVEELGVSETLLGCGSNGLARLRNREVLNRGEW